MLAHQTKLAKLSYAFNELQRFYALILLALKVVKSGLANKLV